MSLSTLGWVAPQSAWIQRWRVAVLTYISQLLLRTLPGIEQERDAESSPDAGDPVIVLDVARPLRSKADQPS